MSQFPRPRMQEIGRSASAPLPNADQVTVTCKRGHTTHGYVNYCPVCGTKFFLCTCGEYVCFDRQHAHIAFVNPDRIEVTNWVSETSRRIRSWFS